LDPRESKETLVAKESGVSPDMPLWAGRETSEMLATRVRRAGLAPRASKASPDVLDKMEGWVPLDLVDPLATPAGTESMAWTDFLAPRVSRA